MSDLAAILKGENPETETTAPANVGTENSEKKIDESLNKTTEETTKGDEKEVVPPTTEAKEKEEPESWTKTAVIDERRKRQDAERKLAEKDAEIAALKASKAQPTEQTKQEEKQEEPVKKVERPDVWEDPEKAFAYSEQMVEHKAFQRVVKLTEAEMKETHSDYEEMSNHFMKMARENPYLAQQLYNAPNPAKFAYNTAKNHLESQKLSDPNYKKNFEEEIRKKILAELAGKQEVSADAPKVNIPDLANANSAESGDKTPEKKSLGDILPPIANRKKSKK